MSGLLAAVRLGQAGVPYVVLEKNADVGGTWFENTYPGCRVDCRTTSTATRSRRRTTGRSSSRRSEVLLDYFRECVDEFGIRDAHPLRTEVLSAAFDEDAQRLEAAACATPDGEETLEANAVISAVGQLNRPQLPEIDGHASASPARRSTPRAGTTPSTSRASASR